MDTGLKQIFEKIGVFIEDNPLPLLILSILLIFIAFEGATMIKMASDTSTFVDKDSKMYQDYDHLYLDMFYTQSIVVMIEDGEVSNPELVHAIDRFEQLVRPVDGVVETTGLASVIRQTNFDVNNKYELPSNENEIEQLLDIYAPKSVVPDNTHTFVFIEVGGDVSYDDLREILRIVEESVVFAEFPAGYNVIVTGDADFNIEMEDEMNSSISYLLMISIILMFVVLYIVFRHVRWRLLPLGIVMIGVIYTFGAMGFLDIPMTMVSMAAFPILIGLGIDYAIQFHNRIEEELECGECESEAVVQTVKHTGPAVLIALLITSMGFVSLFTSTVPMIQDFGKLLLIGVAMCFIASLFVGVTTLYGLDGASKNRFISKISSLIPKREKKTKKSSGPDKFETLLRNSTKFTLKHPVPILFLAGLLCVSGIYTDTMIPIEADTKTFVPSDMKALLEWTHMGSVMEGGTTHIDLIIKVEDVSDPAVIQWMEEFGEHETEHRANIYGSEGMHTLLKSYNGGVLPSEDSEIEALYSVIPESQSRWFMHDDSFLLMQLDTGNAWTELGIEGIGELVGILEDDVRWMQPPPGVSVTVTGDLVVMTTLIDALTSGRIMMTLTGLFMVLGGLLVIYRDWLKAFVPVATMFVVIGWAGGVMYFTDVPYTPMTATLGALILGVGSEYAVLMMERYYEEKEKGFSPHDAMVTASGKIGKAIIASGLTTLFGFSALIASPFGLNSNFGLVTVIDVALALFATFVVFPPLIVYLDSWREERNGKSVLSGQEVMSYE
ncbi:hydrophobe/amphiphile efflux-3 (HAE3) family protein [Methanohalophilus levihalophilus]|uniref:RND family transporter n=1 Tax=Methanohalophilus levihalophilus TaxID=1431282 RepID=UPI00315A24A7|nr:hydrophobe/amphiphile efflux-3 (HAE3) family protein [Methanohalophilus levihalophilus]